MDKNLYFRLEKKKMFKRRNIVGILLTLLISICLIGCGKSPQKTTEEFLKYIKNYEIEKADDMLLSGDKTVSDCLVVPIDGVEDDERISDFAKKYEKYTQLYLKEMSYSVIDTITEEDKTESTVYVDIEYVDISDTSTDAIKQVARESFSDLINGIEKSGNEYNFMFINNIFSGLEDNNVKASEHMKSTSVVFSLIKTDEGWKIKELPDEMENIFSLGIRDFDQDTFNDVMNETMNELVQEYYDGGFKE